MYQYPPPPPFHVGRPPPPFWPLPPRVLPPPPPGMPLPADCSRFAVPPPPFHPNMYPHGRPTATPPPPPPPGQEPSRYPRRMCHIPPSAPHPATTPAFPANPRPMIDTRLLDNSSSLPQLLPDVKHSPPSLPDMHQNGTPSYFVPLGNEIYRNTVPPAPCYMPPRPDMGPCNAAGPCFVPQRPDMCLNPPPFAQFNPHANYCWQQSQPWMRPPSAGEFRDPRPPTFRPQLTCTGPQNGQMNSNSKRRADNFSNNMHAKKKKTNKKSREFPENFAFYCDRCDRGFKTDEKFQEHNSEHQQCHVKGCSYIAAPKLVELHFTFQHKTGLAKKIWQLESQEDLDQWIADRKRNYPSTENKQRKKAEWEAKRAARREENNNKNLCNNMRGQGRGRLWNRAQGHRGQGGNRPSGEGHGSETVGQGGYDERSDGTDYWRQTEGQELLVRVKQEQSETESQLWATEGHPAIAEGHTGFEIEGSRNVGKAESTVACNKPSSASRLGSLRDKLWSGTQQCNDSKRIEEKQLGKTGGAVTNERPPISYDDKETTATRSKKSRRRQRNNKRSARQVQQLANRKPTLLEKLSAPDVRRGRNVIMQCVKFLVRHFNLHSGNKEIPTDNSDDAEHISYDDERLTVLKNTRTSLESKNMASEVVGLGKDGKQESTDDELNDSSSDSDCVADIIASSSHNATPTGDTGLVANEAMKCASLELCEMANVCDAVSASRSPSIEEAGDSDDSKLQTDCDKNARGKEDMENSASDINATHDKTVNGTEDLMTSGDMVIESKEDTEMCVRIVNGNKDARSCDEMVGSKSNPCLPDTDTGSTDDTSKLIVANDTEQVDEVFACDKVVSGCCGELLNCDHTYCAAAAFNITRVAK